MILNYGAAAVREEKERVLLLGPLCKDPILNALSSSGLGYANKQFSSSPRNWEAIATMVRTRGESSFSAVLAQVTENALILASTPEYRTLMREILDEVGRQTHAILIYTDNLRGEFTSLQSEERYANLRNRLSSQGIQIPARAKLHESLLELIAYLTTQPFRLMPYSFTPDLVSMSLAFFQEVEKGLVVRFYVPTRRIYARELDKLIDLLQDYFTNVMSQPVSLEKRKTGNGVVYSVFSSDGCTPEGLRQSLADLSSLLHVCANDPDRAFSILSRMQVSPSQVNEIVGRYGREARRILVDIEYERRSRLLAIEHQLHAELIDSASDSEIAAIQQEAVASVGSQLDAYTEAGLSSLMPASRGGGNSLVAVDKEILERVRLVIWKSLEGGPLAAEELQIIKLINESSHERERGQLLSAFYELRDKALTRTEKMSAWGKMQAFLARVSPTIGKSVLRVVESYIAHLLARGV